MKSERLPGTNLAEAAQLTSIVVRAGHVISADRADQLATPGRQPLRANRAIPGRILVRRGGILFRIHPIRIRFRISARRFQRDRCTWLRLDPSRFRAGRSYPFFRCTFHGPKVIAQPTAREKRERRVGGPTEYPAPRPKWDLRQNGTENVLLSYSPRLSATHCKSSRWGPRERSGASTAPTHGGGSCACHR